MRTGERFRFVAIVGVVLAMLSAGIGLAGGAVDTSDEPGPTVCEPTGEVVDDGGVVDSDEGSGEGETVDQGDAVEAGEEPGDTEDEGETEDEDCDEVAVEDDAEAASEEDVVTQAQDFEPEDCTAAVGLEAGEAPEEAPTPGEQTGLENAMAHVLWNCLDHSNHGLVNALTHLKENLDARSVREEAREERRAERGAAKAEREAAKAERMAVHEAAKAEHAAAKAAHSAGS